MKKQFHSLLQRIDALSERERGILFVLCSIGVLLLGFTFWLEPQMKLRNNLLTQHQANQTQITLLQEEMQQRRTVLNRDPDIELRAKIDEAKVRMLAMDQDLLLLQKNLVPAEKIDLLLAGILKRNKSLQLISLKSLPVVNLVAATNVKDTVTAQAEAPLSTMSGNTASIQNEHSIYKHEVELTLQGNYLDMLAYMRELEALPERVYWSRSSLQVLEYPKASLRLNLFTLSLEKKWLNL